MTESARRGGVPRRRSPAPRPPPTPRAKGLLVRDGVPRHLDGVPRHQERRSQPAPGARKPSRR
eukprot:7324123-Pyramimonas_sp.AAC.1